MKYNEKYKTTNIKLINLFQINNLIAGYIENGDPSQSLTNGIRLNQRETANNIFESDPIDKDKTINIIQIVDSSNSVLAYRLLYTPITIIADSTITAEVDLFDNSEVVIYDQFELNYSQHVESSLDDEHPYITELEFLKDTDHLDSNNFKCRLETIDTMQTPSTESFLNIKNTEAKIDTVENATYDPLTIYYFNKEKIYNALISILSKLPDTTESDTINDFLMDALSDLNSEDSHPFLGFNAEYGSFLYWYYINNDYILCVLGGSNTFRHIDIYFAKTFIIYNMVINFLTSKLIILD